MIPLKPMRVALLFALPLLAAMSNPAEARTDPLALQGQSATGAGGGTFSSFSDPVLNDAGQTAFSVGITGGTSTSGIYRSSFFGALTAIALRGQSATGAGSGTFSSFSDLVLNDAGQTAFSAGITGGSSTGGIYRSITGGGLTAVALQGQSAIGAGPAGTFSSFSSPVLNEAGQTPFLAVITGGISTQGIYRRNSDNTLTNIALQGQSAVVAGAGTFSFFNSPVLNDAGQTAFLANITGGTSTEGIYRSNSGNTLTNIALQGQSAAGAGGGMFSGFSAAPVLNNAGQTAFRASITGGTSEQGIYRSSSGSALTAIALQGQSATGAGAGTFSSLLNPVLNDAGLIAFSASITGGTSTQGLYLGDGRETVAAQLQGAALVGKTVLSLSMSDSSLNSYGQLAYRASFTDSTSGIFLFTPSLRWRETFSSSWDSSDRWTLGITPGSVHDVSIDPTVALTVTGPAGSVNVRSLTVGSGTGFATLNLGGGNLSAASAVQIANRGILTGTGTISTQVVNAGEVRADNLILTAGLVNNGTVRGMAAGNQRIDANLTNNSGGLVRVDDGETLKLTGTAHSNSGSYELRSGEMQISGVTTNNSSGRILFSGEGGIARFNDGLTNNGQVQVSFGSAEVFGNVTTNRGGKIILSGNSNTTFYDAVDIKIGGELRVSTGSFATFFGLVNQRTGSIFSGSGTKYFEGGLSIGGSPGYGQDSGNVSFGDGSEYLAEIGGITACTAACAIDDNLKNNGFDKYVVSGSLTFGGTLTLVSWEGFTGEAGQSFDLFDWGSVSGQFSNIDATGFHLADGTVLNYSELYTKGIISIDAVQAVPEPESYALILVGLGLVGFSARRQARTQLTRDQVKG